MAFVQCGHHTECGIQAGGHIGDGSAGAHRALPGRTGDRHQPRHALRNLIEARSLAIGAVLPETRNAGQNDARVDRCQRFVVDAESKLHVGPVVLDHHIGTAHQPVQHLTGAGGLQVERDQPLVAMQVDHVGALSWAGHQFGPIGTGGRFDANHIRTEIGELFHAGRAGSHLGQIDDAQAFEGAAGRGMKPAHLSCPS